VPPLLVGNQYGLNMSMLDQIRDDVQMDQFKTFIHGSGLSWDQVLGIRNVPSLEEVDQWKKEYKYDKSLYNPAKLYELGTQMYKLHEWYRGACAGGEHDWIGVKVRDHYYFRGNDVMWIQFNELHQLCHMDSLDKSLLSCYCL
jgi:hypothetical protein